MTTIANGTGVWATLGYNFTDPNKDILTLSDPTLSHMNVVPALLQTWQAQDIANNSTGNYYQNPVSNATISISTTGTGIIQYTTNLTSSDVSTNSLFQLLNATQLANTANAFLAHTNRISGVSDYNTDMQNGLNTYNKPYLQTALSAGKSAAYIVYQTDAIQNTAPTLGSFTSLMIGPQISAAANLIINYPNLIANSITITVDPISGNTSNISNLTYTQVLAISNDVSNTNSLLATRQSADETYYLNLQTLSNKYSTVSQFNNMGETQSYLVNNFIGTPSLISKLNSANTSNT